MAIRKIRNHVLKDNGQTDVIHYESSADIITVKPIEGKITATDVQQALVDLAEIAATGGVTSVNGKTGAVELTKADLGLGNVDNTTDKDKRVAYADEAGKVSSAFTYKAHDKETSVDTVITYDGSEAASLDFDADDFVSVYTSGKDLGIKLVNKGYAKQTDVNAELDKKLDKTGGTITGDLAVNGGVTIGGNLTVNGTTTAVDSETLQVKDKLIEVAHGNTTKLTTPAGLVAPKYDGTNSGALVFDGDGTAYVGDVMLDESGNIDVAQSNLQPLATRTDLVNDNLVKYDGTNQTLVDTGKKISDFATAEQGATANTALEKANANATEISNIKDGTQAVGEATSVTTNIGEQKITDIFETDGKTVKNATNATQAEQADKLSASKNISISGAVTGSVDTDLSQDIIISVSLGDKVVNTGNIADGAVTADKLATSGVTAGTYSAVQVSDKGLVTKGAQMIEYGTEVGQVTPSSNLAIGGFYLELLGTEE